jgi:hypothetical protein
VTFHNKVSTASQRLAAGCFYRVIGQVVGEEGGTRLCNSGEPDLTRLHKQGSRTQRGMAAGGKRKALAGTANQAA